MKRIDEPADPKELLARIDELEAELAEERERDDHVCPHPLVTYFKVSLVILGLSLSISLVGALVEWVQSIFS